MLGLVEAQRAADAVDDGIRHALGLTTFEALVVLGTHPGHEGYLFPTQPRHAATSAEIRQAHLLGGESRAPRREEVADGVRSVHAIETTPIRTREGVPAGAPIDRAALDPEKAALLEARNTDEGTT